MAAHLSGQLAELARSRARIVSRAGHRAAASVTGLARNDPLHRLSCNGRDVIEVGVVVQHGRAVVGGYTTDTSGSARGLPSRQEWRSPSGLFTPFGRCDQRCVVTGWQCQVRNVEEE
jgi:hypothetical protein